MSSIYTNLIATLENTLNAELAKYKCLPFYLAILFLRTNRNPNMFIRRGNIKFYYLNNKNHYSCYNMGDRDMWLVPGDQSTVIRPGQWLEIYNWEGMLDPHQIFIDRMTTETKYLNPYKTTFTVGGNEGFTKHIKKLSKVHIYSRNKNLIESINQLVDLYLKSQGTIPWHYVFPYLFFNQPKYLTAIPTAACQGWATPTFIKYDHYNQGLKVKDDQRGCKYTTISKQDVFILLYNITASMNAHSRISYRRFENMNVQTPEFCQVFDQYYKKEP